MAATRYFIIDFDSTFTKVEALDLLAEISLANDLDAHQKQQEIHRLTVEAMNGTLSFRESLSKRVALLKANQSQVEQLITQLRKNISSSFLRNKDFFEENAEHIYIISNGFHQYIDPIVEELGVKKAHIFANDFTFDAEGNVTGFDEKNPLSQNNGKVEVIRQLKLNGDIYVIGDGYNDYEIKAAGLANKFYAFTENVQREQVLPRADHVAPNLDEILYLFGMNTAISYPKNRIKVLLLENIHADAAKLLSHEGYTVETYSASMDEAELAEKIKDVSILGIRSKTHITQKVLDNGPRLIAIGAFCIGTNQIDLEACLQKGVAVFNAPFSNTRSVVELALGEVIMLMRGIFEKSANMHAGKWDKSAKNSHEIRGKKLGIIGYGNIGAQLSVVAEAVGMEVWYYDIEEKLSLGNAQKCNSLEELLQKCDAITLHIDGRPDNKGFFTAEYIEQMKPGSILINLSRGNVVELDALEKALSSGHLLGAAVDVFPKEPKSNNEPFEHPLQKLPNVILTPHIGGSTEEAQENIGHFVPGRFIDYINTGSTTTSVNFPNLQLPLLDNAHRLIHIHHNVPGIIARINQIFAEHEINIMGQYLKTNETIGYVITDIDKAYDKEVIKKLRNIEQTIKFRVLY